MKVELDHEKLNLAAERAEALASRVRTNAASARRARASGVKPACLKAMSWRWVFPAKPERPAAPLVTE